MKKELNPQIVMEQLKELGSELAKVNQDLYDNSVLKAKAEKEYRVVLAQEILILKTQGERATLILDIAKGKESIALLKLDRDKYEALYDACKYNISSIRDRISVGQSILSFLKFEYENINKIGG